MKRILKIAFVYVPLALVGLSVVQVLWHKWVPVWVTPLMVERCFQEKTSFQGIRTHKWVPLEEISANLQRCVLASEDGRFLEHNGFDFVEIRKMRKLHERKGRPIRGCSTVSQQTAKNCFTWCTRTWLRKGVEAYYTFLIEAFWGKRRILEVYLNVAEMGPDTFGAEAAAIKYFGTSASRLTLSQSASLALCLPRPLRRTPAWTRDHMGARRTQIMKLSYMTALPPEKNKRK